MKPTPRLSLLVACSVLSLASLSLQAGTVRLYRAEDIPDPRVVAGILSGGQWQPRARGATRGLSMSPAATPELPSDGGQDVAEERINSAAREAVAAWNARGARNGPTAPRPAQLALANERPSLPAAAPSATPAAAGQAPAAAAPKANGAGTAQPPAPAAVIAAARASQAAPAAPSAGALALMVAFANNSAQLAPTATRALDAVAEGIKLAGFERRILIEGHTNATGKAAHNLRLSQLRAETVKRYLVAKHGIPDNVLVARGYGSQTPLTRQDPYSAQNRRVQFRTLDA